MEYNKKYFFNNLKYHAVDMRKEFYNFNYTHEQLLSAAKVIYNRGGDDIHDLWKTIYLAKKFSRQI